MLIYTVFVCALLNMGAYCSPTSGSIGPMRTYDSLAACQQEARMLAHTPSPDEKGRFYTTVVDDNGARHLSTQQWYECRSKHVDTWNPAQ